MDFMHANNMPPVVSPAAVAPHAMPHVNVFENKNITENIYVYPYAKPHHHHHPHHYHHRFYSEAVLVLVLFILLVIVLRGYHRI